MKSVNYLVYAIVKFFMLTGGIMPMQPTFFLLRIIARIAWPLAKGRRALMKYNLKIAFGDEKSDKELEEIMWKSFESMFISVGELLHMQKLYNHGERYFEFEGEEIIEKFAAEKRGFFVYGGHFGGWTSPGAVLTRFDLPWFNIVAKPLRNPKMQELFEFMVGKFNASVISTRKTGQQIVEAVERGELVGLYMDQESRRDQGVFVKFFGRDASSHVVPGYLAWKHDIPLIPYWIIRTKPSHFHVIFREPTEYELTDDVDENNRRVAQAIANEVERTIKTHPDQWLWAHNRWRRQADGTKVSVYEKKKKRSRTKARKDGEYLSSLDLAKKREAKKAKQDQSDN